MCSVHQYACFICPSAALYNSLSDLVLMTFLKLTTCFSNDDIVTDRQSHYLTELKEYNSELINRMSQNGVECDWVQSINQLIPTDVGLWRCN